MLKYQLFHGRVVGYSLYVPQPQLLPGNSQPAPVGGNLPGFSFGVKPGLTQGECTCRRCLVFELVIGDVGQECQLVGLCTYPDLLMDLPFYAGETKVEIYHLLWH